MNRTISVSVPATSANLGPGFDCLGLALELRNQVAIEEIESGLEVRVSGEGTVDIPRDGSNLAVRAMESLFQQTGRRPPGLRVYLDNKIPVRSGLGSSAAAVMGGLYAADALVAAHLAREELLRLAYEIEGHPDNVAPALYGGLTLVARDDAKLVVEELPVAALRVGLVLPQFEFPTSSARAVLPGVVPLSDAVHNLSRLGLLIRALANADYERLAMAMDDRLHQPYRLPLIPGMTQAFAEAKKAGATVALSGAGPSIILLAPKRLEAIVSRITAVFDAAGLPSRSWILPISKQGCRIRSRKVQQG